MDSLIIESQGCPLDSDLLKSFERFCLENSASYIYSDLSSTPAKPNDEETSVKHDALIQHLENLSINDASNSKCEPSRCSNKNIEIHTQKKNHYEKLIFVENKEYEKNPSSCFSLKNKDILKYEVEANVKSSNKNCDINFQKKNNNKEKLGIVDIIELEENWFSSSSFETNNSFHNNYKGRYDAFSNENCDINVQKKNNNTEKLIVVDSTELEENWFSSSSFETNNSFNNNYKSNSDASSNENWDINAQKKNNNKENLIVVDNTELEENRFSSSSFETNNSFNNNYKSNSDASSNENWDINAQKKNNNKENLIVVDNTELEENQLINDSFNNNHKSSSDVSTENESAEDELQESVTLRERYPNRHNRTENNKQQRTTPFPQNHLKTYKQQLHLNNFQTPANYHSTPNNYHVSHHEYEYFHQNNASSEIYDRTFPHTEFVTGEIFQNIASSMVSDQIVNGVLPCDMTDKIINEFLSSAAIDQITEGVISSPVTDKITNGVIPSDITDDIINGVIPCPVTDQIANGVIPCEVTDQIINGVIPYTMTAEILDSVVPSVDDIENVNEKCSAEINDLSYFDTLGGKIFSESVVKGCAVPNEKIEAFLDSHFEKLTAEEVEYILKNLTNSKSDSFPCQNHVEDSNIISTSEQISYPNSNEYNFRTESDRLQTFLSNTSVEGFSLNSNLDKENDILEDSSKEDDHEYVINKSSNYSSMVSKNFTSINSECLSPQTSDFVNVSEEIETFISRRHEIVQWEEMKEWVMKGQNNMSEFSSPGIDNWNMLPFVELDSNSISECVNVSEYELSDKKKDDKSKRINHNHKLASKVEEPKIFRIWETAARDELFHSTSFCIGNWELENQKMREQIKNGEIGTEQKKIIHFLKKNRNTKYRGTNLHYAVRSQNIEKVFCIVELHKECHCTTNEINLRDSCNKTVLDYSKENGMYLLSAYLEENDAKENGSCLIKA